MTVTALPDGSAETSQPFRRQASRSSRPANATGAERHSTTTHALPASPAAGQLAVAIRAKANDLNRQENLNLWTTFS